MADLTDLRERLAPHEIQRQLRHSQIRAEVFFPLPGPDSHWKPGRLYVSGWRQAVSAVSACPPPVPVSFLLSASQGSGLPEEEEKAVLDRPQINWILTDLPLSSLEDLCEESMSACHSWSALLAEQMAGKSRPRQLLAAFAQAAGAHLFLLNQNYQVICGCPEIFSDDPAGRLLMDSLWISPETREEWSLPELDGSWEERHGVRSFGCWYLRKLPSGDMWLWLSSSHPVAGAELLRLLAPALAAILPQNEESSPCFRFLQHLAENSATDSARIRQLMKTLPYPLEGYLSCLVIRFAPRTFPPYAYFSCRLEELFPRMNYCLYQGDIVLFHTQPGRPAAQLDFSYPKLQALLEEFSAYAAVSNATHRPRHLRTMYQMACDTLRLAAALKIHRGSSRIFPQEEYTTFEIIDLCARQFIQQHRHEDLIFLIHPAIVQLCRYDQQHHSNLREVMFYYLISDRSLNKTAQKMFMHRNTVLNKVNKILEILQLPLEDGYLQHRLIFSCLILQYYEKVMGRSLRL